MGDDEVLHNDVRQVAFIGRSNVGKSSVINNLAQRKDLAHSSPTPGRTRQINVYLINKSFYLVDLPGYGFAKGSKQDRNELKKLIDWYLFDAGINQSVIVLIIDAKVGMTDLDHDMLDLLEEAGKKVVVIANKVDKVKKSEYQKNMKAIQEAADPYPVIPYSALEKFGVGELINQIVQVK